MSKYKGLFTFDEDSHKYIPIAQADGIIDITLEEQQKMSGTKEGGQKASATNKARYGKDWYAKIGAIGGRNGHTGGFASNHKLAQIAGRKGGLISSRSTQITLEERRKEVEEKLQHERELERYENSQQV